MAPPPPRFAEGGFTVTETDALALPPAPLQLMSNVALAVSAADCSVPVPLAVLAPLQPLVAVHDVALVEVHCSVVRSPDVIDAGVAVNVTVGTGAESATLAP